MSRLVRLLRHPAAQDLPPAICYDDCNRAYKIAESIGKNERLCVSGGTFQRAYTICATCIADHTDSGISYLDPTFGEFIAYCDLPRQTTTGSFILTDGSTTTFQYIIPLGNHEATTTPPLSSTRTQSSTLSASRTSSTANDSIATAASAAPEPDKNPSKAWIAGPAVGGFMSLVLVGVLFVFLRKRSRRARPENGDVLHEKAQLHSDCVPRKPAENPEDGAVHEMEGSIPQPAEMIVNEVPASELPSESIK